MKCSQTEVYEYVKDLEVGILREGVYDFPNIDELNILRIENSYFIDDTLLRFYGKDTTFQHFTIQLKCQFGKLNIISSEFEGWTN